MKIPYVKPDVILLSDMEVQCGSPQPCRCGHWAGVYHPWDDAGCLSGSDQSQVCDEQEMP